MIIITKLATLNLYFNARFALPPPCRSTQLQHTAHRIGLFSNLLFCCKVVRSFNFHCMFVECPKSQAAFLLLCSVIFVSKVNTVQSSTVVVACVRVCFCDARRKEEMLSTKEKEMLIAENKHVLYIFNT